MLKHSDFRFFKNNNLYPEKFSSPAHLSQGLCFSLRPKCISLLYLSVTLKPTLSCLSKDHTLLPYCKIMNTCGGFVLMFGKTNTVFEV